ncbi:hypothetical protein AGLY_015777 [Aphis glycines]|uniref:Uncharacterized protein n=1 Tax=Aphis glycines TaxID=307491 RepID=A0A6G0SZY4_APHGL|nr:hypothetical protein AGLY_015777 [Aphis glycines]
MCLNKKEIGGTYTDKNRRAKKIKLLQSANRSRIEKNFRCGLNHELGIRFVNFQIEYFSVFLTKTDLNYEISIISENTTISTTGKSNFKNKIANIIGPLENSVCIIVLDASDAILICPCRLFLKFSNRPKIDYKYIFSATNKIRIRSFLQIKNLILHYIILFFLLIFRLRLANC